jgi:hypothetical protein
LGVPIRQLADSMTRFLVCGNASGECGSVDTGGV